ncbi:hypothetical protein [Actinomadura sp. 9N407]|uniref:hypothetical protein n=1 Tax=Actinomadura sp. 9N407 TaxID=3375154 RepID=UPI0037ABD0FD
MKRHEKDIFRRYTGVTGMGIGAADESAPQPGRYAIVVYLREERDRPAGPQSIADVPLRFVVTGEIRPLAPR